MKSSWSFVITEIYVWKFKHILQIGKWNTSGCVYLAGALLWECWKPPLSLLSCAMTLLLALWLHASCTEHFTLPQWNQSFALNLLLCHVLWAIFTPAVATAVKPIPQPFGLQQRPWVSICGVSRYMTMGVWVVKLNLKWYVYKIRYSNNLITITSTKNDGHPRDLGFKMLTVSHSFPIQL